MFSLFNMNKEVCNMYVHLWCIFVQNVIFQLQYPLGLTSEKSWVRNQRFEVSVLYIIRMEPDDGDRVGLKIVGF
jgi:hypothetical protein